MQLTAIKKISGVILLESGLHIGAGKDAVEIGGLDNPIIKNPLSNAPYIPGSSLKGKLRSLLESYLASAYPSIRAAIAHGKPCQCGKRECPVCMIFGVSGSEHSDIGPTRILVRDSPLVEKDREQFRRGALPMEIKYENSIDRRRGVAEHPRPLERVPAGVRFALNISLRVYKDDPENLLDQVLASMRLLELDALGGCGSRGCGEIKFENLEVDGKSVSLDEAGIF